MRQVLFLLFLCLPIWSQSFTVKTIAGSNAVTESAAAQTSALASTEGIAIDAAGNVYVADAPDHRIRKIEPGGRIITVAGNGQPGSSGDGGPASAAQLNTPYGLTIDAAGNLYVADLGNARIRRITPNGTISTVAGGGTGEVSFFGAPAGALDAKLNAPRNVAIDSTGTLYISDFGTHRLLRVTPEGQIVHVAGAPQAGNASDNVTALTAPLKSPTALVVDKAGVLYFADSGNSTIRRLQRGLLTKVTSTTGFNKDISFATITGLALDPANGDLYVAEGRDSPVRRLTGTSTPFVFPYGARDLALDATGALWLADGPFVRKISRLGTEIIAGTGSFTYGGDGGPATEARLRSPGGVIADKTGTIYLSDTANHRVRRIDPDGRIQTIAGTGEAGYGGDGALAIAARLRSPMGLALDAAGNLYIADSGNHAIRRVNKAGGIETWAGTGTAGSGGDNGSAKRAELSRPQGLTFDAEGNLTIADTGNHRIAKVSPSGWFTVVAGRGTAGNVGDGALAKTAALSSPTDVDYDPQGELYITDTGNKRIRRVNAQGIINGFPSEGLVEPVALAWTPNGFYLADAARQRIYLLTANGARAEIAGTGDAGFSGDEGPAARAQFNRPMDLALLANGDLIIADQDNHRLRLLTKGGSVNLPVITPGQPGVTAAVSAASLRVAPAVPGGLMTIFGSGLGPEVGIVGQTDLLGRWGTSVDGVEVRFDGLPAPLFYVQDGQINLQVPRLVTGRARVEIKVSIHGSVRASRTVEVAETAPSLFLSSPTQVAALNQDGSVNLPANPASRGAIVTVFATGTGLWEVDLADGAPALVPLPRPKLPVTVYIGGQPAELLYAGAAPGQVGLMQLNVRIPTRTQPGQAAIVVQVGDTYSEVSPMLSVI